MKIVNVTTAEHRRYVPIKGLDSVEAALNTFARGFTPGSRATEQHQVKAMGDSYGNFGAAFYMFAAPHMKGAGNSFVQGRIMEPARAALATRDSWQNHFDYDGMGSFFKTTVEIDRLNRADDLYALGINAAYVGDKPEEGLAEHLGIERTLIWASVVIETAPVNNGFEFDFQMILDKLDLIRVTGDQVAQAMLAISDYGEPKASFVLAEDKDLVVSIGPGAVESRFDYSQRRRGTNDKPIDTWSVKGSVFRGNMRESYEKPGTPAPPTVVISLTRPKDDDHSYRANPIYEPELKTRVLTLRDQIAESLRA